MELFHQKFVRKLIACNPDFMKDLVSNIVFYIRAFLIVIATILYSLVALLLSLIGIRTAYFFCSKNWSSFMLKLAGVTIHVHGLEHLYPMQSRIYVVNHTSYFDIPIVLASIPDTIRFMYRKNLERIPFFGWGLARSPFIGIQREKARDAMKGIDEAVKSISIGESVVIFAEGTRSKDGKLAAFKRGAFLLASRSGKQIVPIALAGAHTIMPKESKRFYPGEVTLTVLPPFETMKNMDKEYELQLQDNVHSAINAVLPIEMKSLKNT